MRTFRGQNIPCKKCSKPVYVLPAEIGKKFFCSDPCYYAYRASPEGIAERFWSRVKRGEGCWIFTGCIGHEGYGSFSYGHKANRRQYQAHRFSWVLTNGSVPHDKLVLHRCDVRACVNPAHLYLGDRFDNARDCIERGRYHRPGKPLLWPELRKKYEKRKQRRQPVSDAA